MHLACCQEVADPVEDAAAEEITLLTGAIGADVLTINQKPTDITLLQVCTCLDSLSTRGLQLGCFLANTAS